MVLGISLQFLQIFEGRELFDLADNDIKEQRAYNEMLQGRFASYVGPA